MGVGGGAAVDKTYHHPDLHFLPSGLLFYRVVEDNVEEDLYDTSAE